MDTASEQRGTTRAMEQHLEHLHLPFLTLSPSLHLLSMNLAARSVFGTPPLYTTHASWMFERGGAEGEHGEGGGGDADLRNKLVTLAEAGDSMACWGRGTMLEVWAGQGAQRQSYRVEAVVQSFDGTSSSASSDADSRERPTSSRSDSMSCNLANDSWTPPIPYTDHIPPPPPASSQAFAILFVRPLTPLAAPKLSIRARPPPPTGPAGSEDLRDPTSTADEAEDRRQRIVERTLIDGFFDALVTEGMDDDKDYKAIVNNLPQVCTTSKKDGRLDFFSKKWYSYTGLTEEQSLDATQWLRCMHVDDLRPASEAWQVCVENGTPYHVEVRMRRHDGEWKWNVIQGGPLLDAQGEVESWVCTITEVEELVRAKSDALNAKEHIKAALTGADIVLFSVDRETTVTYFEGSSSVSGPALRATKDQNLVGQPLRTVWPDVKLENTVQQIFTADQESVQVLTELSSGALEDGKCYRYRLVPLRGGPGIADSLLTGVTIIAADVSKLVATEKALHQSHVERSHLMASEGAAKEASRLKTEFVTNISHEIRTPIATVIGICELLLDDLTLMNSHRALVEKSLRSGEILLDLVGMVLDYGKVEAGKLSLENAPFYLHEAVADAELFSVTARKKGVRFNVETAGVSDTGALMGDRLRLWQVIANVLSNSVKFTTSGSITLRVEGMMESDSQCVFKFVVSDTGIGIDPSVLSTLFTPFRQADTSTARQYGGSGLGLALSKSLVELMGGTIQLDSVLGEGTTMTVIVPLQKATTSPTSPTLPPRGIGTPSRSREDFKMVWPRREDVRILLAEDNDLIREIVMRTLMKMKFSVKAVEDGNAAVRAIEEQDYDLILMDGQMPGLDGYEATSKIRMLPSPFKRKVKIIALTASAVSGDRERCITSGMDGYLAKPVRAKELEAAIWEQLGSRVPTA